MLLLKGNSKNEKPNKKNNLSNLKDNIQSKMWLRCIPKTIDVSLDPV